MENVLFHYTEFAILFLLKLERLDKRLFILKNRIPYKCLNSIQIWRQL